MKRNIKPRRRNYLIKPAFQLRFMACISFSILLAIGAIYLVHLWYLNVLVVRGQDLGLAPNHVYFEYIGELQTLMTTAILGVSGVILIGLMVGGLVLSHRIASPIVRVHRLVSEALESGETPDELVLRPDDYFPEVAAIANKLIEYYRRSPASA